MLPDVVRKEAEKIPIDKDSGKPKASPEHIPDRMSLLASIVEYSTDAIITKTSKTIITSWNRGAEEIYGYTADEVVGHPISILIPPGKIDEVPALLERIERGETPHHYETLRRRKDGQRIHVSQTLAPMKNVDDRIVGASTIARDITTAVETRKEAEEGQGRLPAGLCQRIRHRIHCETAKEEVRAIIEEKMN